MIEELKQIEDLKYWIFDNFLSTEHLEINTTNSGSVGKKIHELKLSTGAISESVVRVNYDYPIFNPRYSELVIKARLNTKENVIAYLGFMDSIQEPSENMTFSHAGFLIINNKIYVTSADGYYQQKAEIVGLDITKPHEFKIKFNEFYIKPLPYVISYLGLPYIESVKREWELIQKNTTYYPEDKVHYIVFYLKNTTTEEKFMYVEKIIYKEEYPD